MNSQPKPVYVTESFLPPKQEYIELIEQLWDSKYLTNRGAFVLKLEEKMRSHQGSQRTPILMTNGTLPLQIALKRLVGEGNVITTPFSYVATTSSIVWEGLEPVFVDINAKTLNIDSSKIEASITDDTKAILATHVYGNTCDVDQIQSIADRHGLKVIYDAAHCFGVKFRSKSIFDVGNVSTLSLHATKLFHTAEGGALYCDEELYDGMFSSHNFGHAGAEAFSGLGINAKMSELNAAMGLAILPYVEEIIQKRKVLSDKYDLALKELKVEGITWGAETERNYAYYPVLFHSHEDLMKTIKRLAGENIFIRRYFYPTLNHLPYVNSVKLPIADDTSQRVACLPLYPTMEDSVVNRIAEKIALL